MESMIDVNGVQLWHRISGKGEQVVQIHGAGFGHFNCDPATPILSRQFQVIDYDQRGYGQSDKPAQEYSIDVWADDVAGLLRALGVDKAHIHGTSMGGMVAIVFAGKYPELTRSVVINCAAAKLSLAGRLIFQNWIDIVTLDPAGPGSRTLAELIAWEGFTRAFLASDEGPAAVDLTQQILRDSNRLEVFIAACRAMCDMDLRPWLPRITAPALILGGDLDIMTPWDQGPGGAGQEAIFQGIPNAKKYLVRGCGHSTILEKTQEHCQVVLDFFTRHSDSGPAAAQEA